jgi:hypothetical protein
MIVEAIFFLCEGILGLLSAALPEGTLDLPDLSSLGTWFGENIAPFDRWMPVTELAAFLVVVTSIWMPAAASYQLAVWVYKHLPVLGKG